MKKHSVSSRLLCLLLVFFCMAQVAFAEEVPTETRYVAVDGPSANIDLAFGSVCILNGCRTVDGYVPLAGSERRLDTAQAAFAFERNTGTLVYSMNPDTRLPVAALPKWSPCC